MKNEITIDEEIRCIFFLVFLFVLIFGYFYTNQLMRNLDSVELQNLSIQNQREILQFIKTSTDSKQLNLIGYKPEHPKEQKIEIRSSVKQHIENRNIGIYMLSAIVTNIIFIQKWRKEGDFYENIK